MKKLLSDYFKTAPTGAQTRIADALGIRPSAVNKWALGQTTPPSQRWPMLEELMGLDPETLAAAAITPHDADSSNDEKLDEILRLVAELHERMGDVERRLGDRAPAPDAASGRRAAAPGQVRSAK